MFAGLACQLGAGTGEEGELSGVQEAVELAGCEEEGCGYSVLYEEGGECFCVSSGDEQPGSTDIGIASIEEDFASMTRSGTV